MGFAAVTILVWVIRLWLLQDHDVEVPIWVEPILLVCQWLVGTFASDMVYRFARRRTGKSDGGIVAK
jgi:hypothetical protein